ncbi:MAG: metalloprotease [Firmicutes bacterium]|nr:metalloprotease [Bacillota bacterium]
MDVKPIENYKNPTYPTKEEAQKNPNLLKTMPERWRGNAYAAVAFSSLLLMTLTACSGKEHVGETTGTAGQVAPLFIHGDGRGSFGCVSVAPPAFLSEEEAYSVIAEEAEREGIILTRGAPTLTDITVPKTSLNYDSSTKNNTGTQKGDLALDGYDEEKQIAFEFVSKEDMHTWAGKQGIMSSVETFRFLEAAEVLSKGMAGKTEQMTVATFYDPHYIYDTKEIQEIIQDHQGDYNVMEEKLRERVKADLREQVRDFLSWLKSQGIV